EICRIMQHNRQAEGAGAGRCEGSLWCGFWPWYCVFWSCVGRRILRSLRLTRCCCGLRERSPGRSCSVLPPWHDCRIRWVQVRDRDGTTAAYAGVLLRDIVALADV